ncbi:SDR family oxidoreductase [Beijerinckia sp. L45]|uniref:SDR family oxidoreductase n=1 Tax=Beijerinckia sp. L45 TaxID=1641855 RepID=UPI00131E6271|nr:SDR family oxidoreductase [Beijerinckia sp. L45]
MSNPLYAVTGASGQLGRLVVTALAQRVAPSQIVALVRDPTAAEDLAALGVTLRVADYDQPATLDAAFAGVEKVLLISSNALGARAAQHQNAIDAAARAGVTLLAYTSVLRADISPLGLAEEHRQTEAAIKASGLPFVLLRNGWYTENYTASVPAAVAHGATLGSAGNGRIASAARVDYAEAAVAVLLSGTAQAGEIYELAGDDAYTLPDFAAEIGRQAGKTVTYNDMPEAAFKAALRGFGLPEPLAGLLADSDVAASKGALDDDGHQLSRLIGRATTPWPKTIAAAVQALPPA